MRFIRQHHAGCGVELDTNGVSSRQTIGQRGGRRGVPRLATQLTILSFERVLPEEHVRTNRGAEDRHQHQRVIAVPQQARDEGRGQHLAPWNPDGECRGDIGKQHERQRFQVSRAVILGLRISVPPPQYTARQW
jgi:hypothetical protein